MTAYWFPHPDRTVASYVPVEVGDVVTLDVFCKPCGDNRRPRLQRFVRPVEGGPIGVEPFTAEGQTQASAYAERNGVLRWRLLCPQGHDTYVREPQLSALLDLVERDAHPPRVSL